MADCHSPSTLVAWALKYTSGAHCADDIENQRPTPSNVLRTFEKIDDDAKELSLNAVQALLDGGIEATSTQNCALKNRLAAFIRR